MAEDKAPRKRATRESTAATRSSHDSRSSNNNHTTTATAAVKVEADGNTTTATMTATTAASAPADVQEQQTQPKIILSHAERRRLRRPQVTVTAEMREAARERTRELRKHLRMLKSNGARRKVAKLREKRQREDAGEDEEAALALEEGYRLRKKGRRLE